MKFLLYLLLFISVSTSAQLPINEQEFLSRLNPVQDLPPTLLSTRTVVFYPYTMSMKELEMVQKSFQKTGIDAVLYMEADLVCAGRDPLVALADYLTDRELGHLVYFQKESGNYRIYITPYNKRANLTEDNQDAFTIENQSLEVLLQQIYRIAIATLKNENLLINDVPESGVSINAISGKRNEYFAIDLKVDALAVPKFGDEEKDKALEEIMKLYPYKFTLTEAALSENELRKKGYLYVLRFTTARNIVARDLLGYKTTRSQTAIVSEAYLNDTLQLKNISVNENVFKFYFKHIESKDVFLGRKWDADPDWQQALINQLKAYKQEFRLN